MNPDFWYDFAIVTAIMALLILAIWALRKPS